MVNKLKIFLGVSYILVLLIFLYFLFSQIQLERLDDFFYYKEIQQQIKNTIGNNFYFNMVLFFVFSIIWVILLGFGSPILILSGIFFGKWIGTAISLLSITLGALFLYLIASFFFKDIITVYLEKKFSKYIKLFRKNEFYYFFAFRFVGGFGIPFGIQNVLPVLFNISKNNYFFASFLGFIPNFYIWNTIGSGINNLVEKSEEFNFINFLLSREIYLPLSMFIALIIVSFFVKRRVFYSNESKK
tara:strand:+ start:817 stop:1548 length:732 start_codon:yes stop_codon:yes gene_type:complete